jgi:hypothetical protein
MVEFGYFAMGQIILTLAVTAGLIIYMYRVPYVPTEKRGLWVAVLLLAAFLAFPFFWFHYIWKPSR